MKKLLPVEKRVYELIRKKGGIDVNFISSRTGVPPPEVLKIVSSLVTKGVLVELGLCKEENCNSCPLWSFCIAKPNSRIKLYIIRGEKN